VISKIFLRLNEGKEKNGASESILQTFRHRWNVAKAKCTPSQVYVRWWCAQRISYPLQLLNTLFVVDTPLLGVNPLRRGQIRPEHEYSAGREPKGHARSSSSTNWKDRRTLYFSASASVGFFSLSAAWVFILYQLLVIS
jgi:hypothetical protein